MIYLEEEQNDQKQRRLSNDFGSKTYSRNSRCFQTNCIRTNGTSRFSTDSHRTIKAGHEGGVFPMVIRTTIPFIIIVATNGQHTNRPFACHTSNTFLLMCGRYDV